MDAVAIGALFLEPLLGSRDLSDLASGQCQTEPGPTFGLAANLHLGTKGALRFSRKPKERHPFRDPLIARRGPSF